MAQYIDLDKLLNSLEDELKDKNPDDLAYLVFKLFIGRLSNEPTADVVPKSEVERLSKELDELAEEYSDLIVEKDRTFDEGEGWYKKAKELEVELDAMRTAANSYKMHYNNLAREIFEEIENNYADFLFDGHRNIVVLTEKDFAELKKKYTEGEANAE